MKAWTNAVKKWTQDGIVTQEGVVPPSSSAAKADKQLKNGDVTAAGESLSNLQWREPNDKYPVVPGLTDGIQAYPIIQIEITDDGLEFAANRLVESFDNNGIADSITGRYHKDLENAYSEDSSPKTSQLERFMKHLGDAVKSRANGIHPSENSIETCLQMLIEIKAHDDTPDKSRSIVDDFVVELGMVENSDYRQR